MSKPSDDIRKYLLNVQDKACIIYSTFLHNIYVCTTDTISSTTSRSGRYKLKTIKKFDHCKKSNAASKIDFPSHLLQHRNVWIARVRGLEKLLIPSSYLFEEKHFKTKPIKRKLVQERGKELSADKHVSPINWELCQSTFLVDVMANFRKIYIKRLNTSGELSGNHLDYCIDIRSTWIDFVFNTNIVFENSVIGSERSIPTQ